MKLSEIVASLKDLKETVANFIGDKTKATSEALTGFSSKLTALETDTVAQLTQAQSDLTTAKASVSTLTQSLELAQGQVNAIGGALKTSCAAMKLEIKEGASSTEMISAMQGAVTSTLAKLQVNADQVPAGKPTTAAGMPVVKKSLDQEIKDRQAANATK